jgi:hypothetical protein
MKKKKKFSERAGGAAQQQKTRVEAKKKKKIQQHLLLQFSSAIHNKRAAREIALFAKEFLFCNQHGFCTLGFLCCRQS